MLNLQGCPWRARQRSDTGERFRRLPVGGLGPSQAPLRGWTLGPYPDTEQKRSLNVLSPSVSYIRGSGCMR